MRYKSGDLIRWTYNSECSIENITTHGGHWHTKKASWRWHIGATLAIYLCDSCKDKIMNLVQPEAEWFKKEFKKNTPPIPSSVQQFVKIGYK